MKKIETRVLLIAAFGFAIRALFLLFVGKIFFGKPYFLTGNDTDAWAYSFVNLYNTGTYTFNPTSEYGFFARMPGYSFFMGLFYMLISHDWNKLFPIIAWTQIVFDTISIILIYRIGEKLFSNKKTATILAVLYSFYPFIIVWTPVAYSECMSIFLLLAGVYYYLSEEKRFNYCISGLLIGLAVLFRPQILPIAPLLAIFPLIKGYGEKKALLKVPVLFTLFFLIGYAPWPIRNYVNHNKLILTQDLRGFYNWNPDVLSFLGYVYSVKAEWDPQFTEIIKNEKVEWPKEAYLSPGDSAKLNRAVYLSQNCGRGFSMWTGYWKGEVKDDNCDLEIKRIFDELRAEQIAKNPMNFWVYVPLQNLKKAFFKTSLVDSKSKARKIGSLLFIYRTILIFAGLIGCFMILRSGLSNRRFVFVFLGYFVLLYIILCAGTSPQMRDIEMRYFLPADILLLIPAAYLIHGIGKKLIKNGE